MGLVLHAEIEPSVFRDGVVFDGFNAGFLGFRHSGEAPILSLNRPSSEGDFKVGTDQRVQIAVFNGNTFYAVFFGWFFRAGVIALGVLKLTEVSPQGFIMRLEKFVDNLVLC